MKTPYSREVMISQRLRFARINANLTQKEVSARAGISSRNYSKYEVGETFPPPDVMVRLCQVLGVTSDFLLGLSDEYTPGETSGSDFLCLTGSDGYRHMYSIPNEMSGRVSAMLMAGFPELMRDDR